MYFSVLDIVVEGKRFRERSPMSYIDWKQTKRVSSPAIQRLINRLWDWPYKLDDIKLDDEFHRTTGKFRMPFISSDEFYSKDLKRKIDNALQNLNYKTKWKEKARDYYLD